MFNTKTVSDQHIVIENKVVFLNQPKILTRPKFIQKYIITAVFLEFEPYYKVVYLIEKLSLPYFRISNTWIQIWIPVFNIKKIIFDISQEHSILILTIDLRGLGHGEQHCLLDFLAEMQLFCSLQRTRKYNEIY